MIHQRQLTLLAGLLSTVLAVDAGAQAPEDPRGRLVVTVADQTGAVIANATVRALLQSGQPVEVAPAESATPRPDGIVRQTSDQGEAVFDALTPGAYVVEAEFPGFQSIRVEDVRVDDDDDTRRAITLPIARVEERATVRQDPRVAASDRQGPAFGSVLTREQIDALSDDPEEMRRQLQEMAGPGAIFRVDSFEGAPLPPKSQIRMIRISRDAFAAENHGAGGISIDIVTQPGIGPLRTNVRTSLRPGSLTGRSPFVPVKGPERSQQYSVNLSGSLVENRTSFSLNVGGTAAFQTPNLNVATLTGTLSEALGLRQPRDQWNVGFNLDHAITPDQTLRFGFNRSGTSSENLGIGNYDLPERAYATDSTNYSARIQHVGPVGRRFFINNRIQIGWNDSTSFSTLEAPTIRVLDAFTSGGQQQAGGARTRTVNAASDLDYVRGIHSLRTGLTVQGGWYHSDQTSNYLGTYTFESLEAFEAGQPRSYTRRVGDPLIDYGNVETAWYLQDDIRVRQNLTLSPGLRYEAQTHVSDYNNVGPRFGATWAPGEDGSMTVRGSVGLFYDWLGTGTYEQTLRVDGFRQRELDIADPTYPDPGDPGDLLAGGFVPPVNRYLLGEGMQMPRQFRVSAGLDRSLTRQSRIGVTWAHMLGTSLHRGENLNAPVNGVRPDPEFGNVIQVVSDARSREDTVTVFFSASFTRPRETPGGSAPLPVGLILPGTQNERFIDWRRLSLNGQYVASWLRNDTDGDFSVPATGSLDREWGAGPGDIPHRFYLSVSAQTIRNLSTSLTAQVSSGNPYTLRTGLDDNGDLIFNDRPEGVARGTERANAQWSLNLYSSYSFTFGRPREGATPQTGIFITSIGGTITSGTVSVPQRGRYSVNLYVQVQNLTNRSNYVGYSGVLTSPFFGQPRDVTNPRRVDIGMNFSF